MKKTTAFYKSHPEAKAKKDAYNTKYESSPERKKYRAELGRINAKKGKPHDGLDVSHRKNGSTTLEKASTNRARQGSGNNKRLK